ncbi:hypothetical protein [Clostridium merdae]|uniref:hypothetical protein n=1 Tax=Clostridium merdae TaxID=1958780 RepID=UPI000A26ABA3|nr:hypothetical protein [Clostridium merdae]
MPDITSLFQGSDAVNRNLFNQKISDINAHGNDTTRHVTEKEREVWNGKATTTTYTATLSTAGWSANAPHTQTVTVSGLLEIDNPIIDVVLSDAVATAQAQLDAWGYVSKIVTGENSIVVYCYDAKPTIAIPIQILVVR